MIKRLIEKTANELQCVNYSTNGVGNRPHYPMFVLSNTSTNLDLLCQFRKNAELVWPQSASSLVYTSYDSHTKKFYNIDGLETNVEELSYKLDEVKCNYHAFAEMKRWCVYNVVDTSSITDIEDFKVAYGYINIIKDIVVDTTQSMLIVILDDSSRMREIANKIKCFLSKSSKEYDGILIVSNRTMDNAMQSKLDICKVVSNVFTLSNNDAVAAFDNADYSTRNSILYSNRINTVSYTKLEQPKIEKAVQMLDIVLSEVCDRFDKKKQLLDKQQWKDLFGIKNGKIVICERYISNANITFDIQALSHIPLKRIDIIDDDFRKISFAKLKECTFDGVVENFIENYYTKEIENVFPMETFEEEYIEFINKKITSDMILELDVNVIEEIYKDLCAQNINNSTSIEEFIINEICCNIRKKVYLKFKMLVSNMINDAQRVKTMVFELHTYVQKELPLIEPEFMGVMHKNLTNNYINSLKGDADIKGIMSTKNKIEDVEEGLFDIVKSVIVTHLDDFAKNFAAIWTSIFGTSTEGVTKLRLALDNNFKKRICLNGVFAIENVLSVYMFHTTDITGNTKTPLLNLMQQAYTTDDKTQFFNTGMDDSIEVMKFVDCSGNKLEL